MNFSRHQKQHLRHLKQVICKWQIELKTILQEVQNFTKRMLVNLVIILNNKLNVFIVVKTLSICYILQWIFK